MCHRFDNPYCGFVTHSVVSYWQVLPAGFVQMRNGISGQLSLPRHHPQVTILHFICLYWKEIMFYCVPYLLTKWSQRNQCQRPRTTETSEHKTDLSLLIVGSKLSRMFVSLVVAASVVSSYFTGISTGTIHHSEVLSLVNKYE